MMKISRYYAVSIGIALICLLWGCASQPDAPVYHKNGETYGQTSGAFFRHRWWNYYERGLSYAEGRYFDDAVNDLEAARSQRDKDQRMARTYGMHFIDYFPHRELGILYYEIGDMERAKQYLLLSIEQYPSAKAHFYLDQVRREGIRQSGKLIAPPTITLDFDSDVIWTREDPVTIKGKATDGNFIEALRINDHHVFMDTSQNEFSFQTDLSLPQGMHLVSITATNLAGKTAERTLEIHIDRQGPSIAIEEIATIKQENGTAMEVRGVLSDPSGIESVRINSEPLPAEPGNMVPFRYLMPHGQSALRIDALDRVGNQTHADISTPETAARDHSFLVATTDTGFIAGLLKPKDRQAPVIKLKEWNESQTVYMEDVYVDGMASDDREIADITVNGESIASAQGQMVFFSRVLTLKEGVNTFQFMVTDTAGNKTTQTIEIIRRIPEALQLDARLKVSVFPFEKYETSWRDASIFQEYLIDALVDQNRFRLVERNKLNLLLQEQRLSTSRLVDRSAALEIGRLAAAQSIIAGSIVETRHGIEIVSRMIDTETSDILSTIDVFGDVKSRDVLSRLAHGLALKYCYEFPLVSGLVIHTDNDTILTDMGQEKIKVQQRLIVYRERPVLHPVDNRILGTDKQILCRARVVQVQENMSKARLIDEKHTPIEELYKVIVE